MENSVIIPSSERTCHFSSPVSFFLGVPYVTVGEGRCCLGVRKNYDIIFLYLRSHSQLGFLKSIAKMIARLVLEHVIVTTWCVRYTYKPSSPELSQGHSVLMYPIWSS